MRRSRIWTLNKHCITVIPTKDFFLQKDSFLLLMCLQLYLIGHIRKQTFAKKQFIFAYLQLITFHFK